MGFQIGTPPLPSPGRSKQSGTEYLELPGVELSGSVSSFAPGNNGLYYFPIFLSAPATMTGLLAEIVVAGSAGAKARMGIYSASLDRQPTTLIVDGGEVDIASTGVKEASINVALAPGLYLLAWHCNSASATIRFARGGARLNGILATLGANFYNGGMAVTTAYGALAANGVAWTAALAGSFSQPPPYWVFCRLTP